MDYVEKLQELTDEHDLEIEITGSISSWYVSINCPEPGHYINCKREALEDALNDAVGQLLQWLETDAAK
jgi:hypothetical protein